VTFCLYFFSSVTMGELLNSDEEHLAQRFAWRKKDKKVVLRHLYSCLIWTALLLDRLHNPDLKICCKPLSLRACFDS